MLFLLSENGGPEGFAPIPSSSELPYEKQQHRRYSHGVGFIADLIKILCLNEVKTHSLYAPTMFAITFLCKKMRNQV